MMKFTMKSFSWAIPLLLLGAMLAGCASLGEPHYRMPEIKGKVVDMETDKPVKGAVALAVYRAGDISVTDSGSFAGDAQKATTDARGEFLIPNTKIYNKGGFGKLSLGALYLLSPQYFPEKIQEIGEQPIKLRKVTHYLHYTKLPEFPLDLPDQNAITSAVYQDWLHAVQSPRLSKTGSAGVFLHDPERKFSKLFWQGAYYDADQAMGGSFIHVFDEKNQQWLAIDCTGHTAPVGQFAMKNWLSMSSQPSAPPIFAGKDIIYILPDRDKQQADQNNKVSEIIPTQGGISAISGDMNRFYTIEGDGKYFCIYTLKEGRDLHEENAYTRKSIPRGEISIFSDEISSALPTIQFVSTIIMDGASYPIICTKSPSYCRVYLCRENKDGYFIEPILVFPSEREITAITASGVDDSIYIALKNNGIKKYSAKKKPKHLGVIFLEDETFYVRSQHVHHPEVVSMAVGDNGLTGSALYAVTKNDLIYRFAADGTPDYMVKYGEVWR